MYEISQLEIPPKEREELIRRAQEGQKLIEWVRGLNPGKSVKLISTKDPEDDARKLQMDEDLATWRARQRSGIHRAPTL